MFRDRNLLSKHGFSSSSDTQIKTNKYIKDSMLVKGADNPGQAGLGQEYKNTK